MSKLSNVWVFSDVSARLAEIIAGGFEVAEKVSALVIGSDDDVAAAFANGANEVYHLGDFDSSRIIESYTKTIASIINKDERSLILMPGTKRCKAIASLLGVELNAGVVTEVSAIEVADDAINCKHMVYGGLAIGQEAVKSSVAIAVVTSGTFTATEADSSKTGTATAVDFIEPKNIIKCVERKEKEGSSVDLNKAKNIVSIGRGIAKQEDIKIAEDLCVVMEAELGCSRPIAEGEKWMEHERYIGISSVMAKPEIYFAIGISGQIQHMVGAKDSQTIIAVNKDKNAPIFDYADYGIVGDLYKVLPAVIEALKK